MAALWGAPDALVDSDASATGLIGPSVSGVGASGGCGREGDEVLVLCRMPELESSELLSTVENLELIGFDTDRPRLVADNTFHFVGAHARSPCTYMIFGPGGESEGGEEGIKPAEVVGLTTYEAILQLRRAHGNAPPPSAEAADAAETLEEADFKADIGHEEGTVDDGLFTACFEGSALQGGSSSSSSASASLPRTANPASLGGASASDAGVAPALRGGSSSSGSAFAGSARTADRASLGGASASAAGVAPVLRGRSSSSGSVVASSARTADGASFGGVSASGNGAAVGAHPIPHGPLERFSVGGASASDAGAVDVPPAVPESAAAEADAVSQPRPRRPRSSSESPVRMLRRRRVKRRVVCASSSGEG
eukprot:TRINITY_DN11112_c0_g1_i1.p1 TRINITY_DN11112_c0_g1~~TRINITY_DN11112_c0_g1_i1.p1  ORF type:complete len:368 (+),score=77.39 TRINITY_DN11112_c0_g1_i1:257-1360(+)